MKAYFLLYMKFKSDLTNDGKDFIFRKAAVLYDKIS